MVGQQGVAIVVETEGTATPPEPDPERARLEALSQEILAEGTGGAAEPEPEFGGGKPTTPPASPDATDAGGDPSPEGTADKGGSDGPGSEKAPKWAKDMPESLRGRLADFSEEELAYIRGNAENGLRQADYSRLTQQLPSKDDLAVLMQSHQALEAIKANPEAALKLMAGQGAGEGSDGEEGEEESLDSLSAALLETADPKEFAAKLKKILQLHGESVRESLKSEVASTPSAKARRVNAAAKQIREERFNDVDDETWAKACAGFQESCEQRGVNWYDVPPDRLDFYLEPYIRLAQANRKHASPKPGDSTEPRAAALPPSQAGTETRRTDAWEREGREATEDELFEKTLQKFGLTEQQLTRLRAMGG